MKAFFWTLFLLSVFFISPRTEVSAETKVGVILPMTGDFARYGEKVRTGLESNRIEDVKFIYEDEGCNPQIAATAYKKLSSIDQIKILVGPWCGSPQITVASMLERGNQIAILGSSAPRRVFELSRGRMFSVQHSIEEESNFNAKEASRLGARKVVIIFFENDFSRAHEAAFRGAFGGQVLDTLVYSSMDASALKVLATKVKQLDPDTLYIPDAFPLMHGILKQLASLGVKDKRIMSVYSAQSDDVLNAIGKNGEGMLLSYPKISDEALVYFPKLAAEILIYGLKNCNDGSPECIRKAISEHYDFDEFGILRGSLGMKIVKNGKYDWFQG